MHRIMVPMELRSISPEAKFFLVRFVQLYGLRSSVRLGVKELSQATDVTDRVVSRSLRELVEFGLFVHTKIREGKGRPKSEYTCSLLTVNLLQERCKNAASIHDAKIDYVLNGAGGRNNVKLSITNRLLTALLLNYANKFGVIRNLGLSDLSKRTGLNRDRVKTQLHKLHSLGVIRSSVPGATDSQLFGPTKSIYFLNLHSALLNQGNQSALILIRTGENDLNLNSLNEACWIIHAADLCKGDAFDLGVWMLDFLPRNKKYERLAALFYPRVKSLKILPLLQVKIEEYASALLSRYWNSLPKTRPDTEELFFDNEIVTQIKKDFAPPGAKTVELEMEGPLYERTNLMAEFIYHVAFLLACRIIRIFPVIERMPYKRMDFLILPNSNQGRFGNTYTGSRTLLVIPHENLSTRYCYVIKRSESGEFSYEEFKHEDDIATERRLEYGLLSKKAVPKRYAHCKLASCNGTKSSV